jgi:hypothetical protein
MGCIRFRQNSDNPFVCSAIHPRVTLISKKWVSRRRTTTNARNPASVRRSIAWIVLPALLTVGCSSANNLNYRQGYEDGSIGTAATIAANAGDPNAACKTALHATREQAGTKSDSKQDNEFLSGCRAALNARYG